MGSDDKSIKSKLTKFFHHRNTHDEDVNSPNVTKTKAGELQQPRGQAAVEPTPSQEVGEGPPNTPAVSAPLQLPQQAAVESEDSPPDHSPQQAQGTTPTLARDISLWDRAYDAIDKKLVAEYEVLLSRVLVKAQSSSVPMKVDDNKEVINQIPQHDEIARRSKMKEVIALGLQHMKDKKVSTTILGHELVLQDVVAQVAGVTTWAESYIKDAAKDLPYASIVVAGVSLVLPILKNPPVDEAENQAGFTYVTSQLRYYVAMEHLLVPDELTQGIREDLTDRLLGLYKLIIQFQISSVIRFYRSRTKNYFRSALKLDGWAGKTDEIKTADVAFRSLFDTTVSGSSLQKLEAIAGQARDSLKALDDLNIKAQELIDIQRNQLSFAEKLDQRMASAEDRECLQALQATDPRDDKRRIELAKGNLLRDSYSWVLDNNEFLRWRRGDSLDQLLWISGSPGRGKTMLVCGIIDELTQPGGHDGNIAFFLCQATDNRINSATAALKGLIYLLIKQQPGLVVHLRERYDDAGKVLFEGPNAFSALTQILDSMLGDDRLENTIMVIDALDEIVPGDDLTQLVDFVVATANSRPRAKWMVSSRNWTQIEEGLASVDRKVELSLDQNEQAIADAVGKYIKNKVDKLDKTKSWGPDTRGKVLKELTANANNTFLWVALVCKALEKTTKFNVLKKLSALPPGLDALYMRMFDQLRKGHENEDEDEDDNFELCRSILEVACIALRPLTLDEMFSYVEVPGGYTDDESLSQAISMCGSFLTLRERTVVFVHQSAADFLGDKVAEKVFVSGRDKSHRNLLLKSLEIMSLVLRRDIYHVKRPGVTMDRVSTPDPDPLAKIRYACSNFLAHMVQHTSVQSEIEETYAAALSNDGAVDLFLKTHFVHWLEALSLMANVSDPIEYLELVDTFSKSPQVAEMARDMLRFVRSHRQQIERGPLQVYTAALLFSPSGCKTRELFRDQEPDWVVTKPAMEQGWDQCLMTLEGRQGPIEAISWSPGAPRVALASATNVKIVWAWSGDHIASPPVQDDSLVGAIVWSPRTEESKLAYWSTGIKVWDETTEQIILSFGEEDEHSATDMIWRDETIVTARGMAVQLWDAKTGASIAVLEDLDYLVSSMAWISGEKLAVALGTGQIWIWNTRTNERKELRSDVDLASNPHFISCIAWLADVERLVSGGHDGTLKSWDVATGECRATIKIHGSEVVAMSSSPDGSWLATTSTDNTVKIFRARDFQGPVAEEKVERVVQFEHRKARCVEWSPNLAERRLASGAIDGTVKIWDASGVGLSPSSPSIALDKHSLGVLCVVFSPDGTRLASSSADTSVRVWDPETGRAVLKCEGHTAPVNRVSWSHEGSRLLSSSEDATWKAWDASTGACVMTLRHSDEFDNTYPIERAVWSHDMTRLASVSDARYGDHRVFTWDAATGAKLDEWPGHTDGGEVHFMAWSRDNGHIATQCSDGTARVWDAGTGACKAKYGVEVFAEYRVFEQWVRDNVRTGDAAFDVEPAETVGFPPVRQLLYDVERDGVWVTREGEPLLALPSEYRPYYSSMKAAHGTRLAIGCDSGRVIFFRFTEEGPL